MKKLKESDIEKQILHWLSLNKIFAWKTKTVGTFDPTSRRFRSTPKHYMKGVSDIIGIWGRRPLAIEVKRPKCYPSPEQRVFMQSFNDAGGIAFVARSIEDVVKNLNEAADASYAKATIDASDLKVSL